MIEVLLTEIKDLLGSIHDQRGEIQDLWVELRKHEAKLKAVEELFKTKGAETK